MNKHTRNLLLTLKNCSVAKLNVFFFQFSSKNIKLLELLYKEGYIQSFMILKDNKNILITLRYFNNKPTFQYLKIFSPKNFKILSFLELSRLINKRYTLFLSTKYGFSVIYSIKHNGIGGQPLFIC